MIDVDEVATWKTMRAIEKQCGPWSEAIWIGSRGRHPIGNRFVPIGLLNSWLSQPGENRQPPDTKSSSSLRAKTFQRGLKGDSPVLPTDFPFPISQLKSPLTAYNSRLFFLLSRVYAPLLIDKIGCCGYYIPPFLFHVTFLRYVDDNMDGNRILMNIYRFIRKIYLSPILSIFN